MIRKFYLLIALIFLTAYQSQGQFYISPMTGDFCGGPQFVTYVLGNTNPQCTYQWYIFDYGGYGTSGQPLQYIAANGTSYTHYTGNNIAGAMLNVVEYNSLGTITGEVNLPIVNHPASQNIPYYFDYSFCTELSVPPCYAGWLGTRWSQWYLNGVPSSVSFNTVVDGPFFGTQTWEYKMSSSCGDTMTTGPITITGNPVTVTGAAPLTRCNGDSVLLTINNLQGTVMGWRLNGSNIPQSSGKYTYYAKTSGTYSLWIRYNNCDMYPPQGVTVQFLPAAIITGNSTGCTGDSILLSCSTASTYQWKFNGSNITGATKQTLYVKQSGSYEVVTTGLGCNNSAPKQVAFYPKSTIAVSPAGTINLCSGEATTLTATGTNISKYQWYRNNAVLAGGNTSTLTITKNGSYKCVATNAAGCTLSSNTVNVVVPVTAALPKVSLVLQPDTAGIDSYINSELGYTGTNFGSASTIEVSNYYKHFRRAELGLLKFDLSAVPEGSPIVSATLRLYADTFKVYNNLSQTFYCKRILNNWTESTVNYWSNISSTDFQFSSLNSTSILSKSFINITVTDLVKHWSEIPADNYGMILMMKDTGSPSWISLASSDNSNKNNRPKLTISYNYASIKANGSTNICTGGSVVLSTDTGQFTYRWYKNGSVITGATSNQYVANTPGNYKVTIYNSAGCNVTSKELTITQNSPPVANVSPNGNVNFCYGSYVWLTADSLTGYSAFQWKLNGNPIAGATQRKYKVTLAGSYTVTVTNVCGVSATSSAVNCIMITNPAPTVTASGPTTFCNGQSVTFTANTFTGVAYQWRKSGVDIPGATASTYTATTAGGYGVRETANGCSRTSGTINVTVNCRTAEEIISEELIISPQPFSFSTNIQLPEETDFTTIRFEVRDMQGKIVALPACTGMNTVFERGSLHSGIYLLHVLQNDRVITTERLMIID